MRREIVEGLSPASMDGSTVKHLRNIVFINRVLSPLHSIGIVVGTHDAQESQIGIVALAGRNTRRIIGIFCKYHIDCNAMCLCPNKP